MARVIASTCPSSDGESMCLCALLIPSNAPRSTHSSMISLVFGLIAFVSLLKII